MDANEKALALNAIADAVTGVLGFTTLTLRYKIAQTALDDLRGLGWKSPSEVEADEWEHRAHLDRLDWASECDEA